MKPHSFPASGGAQATILDRGGVLHGGHAIILDSVGNSGGKFDCRTQSGRGGPKRHAFYHEDMQSCPKRWRSLPQSGRPFQKNLTHARHLAGVRSPSSTLLAFWGRPDGEVKFDGKTRHFRHSRRRILDSVDNSDGKRHESSMSLTKRRRTSWYFLTTHRPREGIRTYIFPTRI